MDSTIENIEKQIANLQLRFSNIESLLNKLAGQQPTPAVGRYNSVPFGGCPHCGNNNCIAGQCRQYNWNNLPSWLKDETQLK